MRLEPPLKGLTKLRQVTLRLSLEHSSAKLEPAPDQPTAQASLQPRQDPPGRTPDMPPPRVNPETERAPQPNATSRSDAKPVPPADAEEEAERTASDSLYGEELPPDFWDDDPVADVGTVAQNEPRPDEVAFEGSSHPTPQPSAPGQSAPRQEVTGKLTDDPRFEVMQSLFPGEIVEWQDSEEGAADVLENTENMDDPHEDVDGGRLRY